MPDWVIVGEAQGTPVVLTSWVMEEGGGLVTPIDVVKRQGIEPVVFQNRWIAKRVIRKRNAWGIWRCIRRDRL